MSDWTKPRRIKARLVITGDLVLTSPAHLGNGEAEGLTAMPLLRDPLEQRPLLTGTSIAGTLRAYLQARRYGFRIIEQENGANVALLFGMVKGDEDEDAEQSPLIVEDALATPLPVEVRDGVRIDARTGVALDKGKFDTELLPTGTSFPLRFELLLPDNSSEADRLKAALAEALAGLEQGEIAIGARRSRGFGRCRVAGWRTVTFDMSPHADLLRWLTADEQDAQSLPELAETTPAQSIASLLGGAQMLESSKDQRHIVRLDATFTLDSPLLIRSEQPLTNGDDEPDFIHLRDAAGRPIISGTSLAGVLRSRATRILNTLHPRDSDRAATMIDELFGQDMHLRQDKPTASRLIVEEVVIDGGETLIQNRVAIDRFSGGALDTALFNEAPQVGGRVTLRLAIRDPADIHLGLLLLLLKDLWTGDLPIGGTSSIGRGQLHGVSATVRLRKDGAEQLLATIAQRDGSLDIGGDRQQLEMYVRAVRGEGHERAD
jgi:CRISPR/Cas system CMR subunit Cmr4 (Cas7 group RAMP superfamily)